MPSRREWELLQDEIYRRMKQHIVSRYRANWTKSLTDVYALDPDFLSVDPAGISFFMSNRKALLQAFADPAAFDSLVDLFVELTLEFSYKSNQFIRVTEADRERLVVLYRSYLRSMERLLSVDDSVESFGEDMRALVRDHFVDLRRQLDRLSAEGLPTGAEANVFLSPVVCREYSPEFQLSILGIDPISLMEPILDVGCGRSGELVQHLRKLGLVAFGVDRAAEASSYLIDADWLDLRMEPSSWGTIISHMAFSNHFIFQHLYRFGSPEEYARQYAAILASLKPGGSFWYAPGLPFVEEHLPRNQFSVVRRQVVLPGTGRDCSGTSLPAGHPYSTQVSRKWNRNARK